MQNSGVLRVGLDPTYPPFEFSDGNAPQGIDVDLARAIARDLGLDVHFTFFGYDGLYDALATNQVDMLISALVSDPARAQDFVYSEGYVNSGLVLASRLDTPVMEVAQLAGKTLAVELGAAGHVQATTWQRKSPDLIISTQPGADEALAALVEGQVDAAIVDNISARIFVARQPHPSLEFVPITEEPYVIVFRREDGRLLREINDALTLLKSNGQLDTILNSWFRG